MPGTGSASERDTDKPLGAGTERGSFFARRAAAGAAVGDSLYESDSSSPR